MKRTLLTSILLLVGIAIFAQIPNGYYNNANGKTGDELKAALHDIIKNHHAVSYNGLLNAFAYTDCDANGKIWDIYSNYHYDLTDNGDEFTQEGKGWNREHTWPQSWFNEQTTPRSDLFHVYPTDGYVNGRRSNYPYGEVNNPTYTSGNGSKLGPCVVSGYSGTVFEPIDEYKGDIARSYFYMSVRYYTEDGNWGTSAMTNKSEIEDWAMTMLLRWSDEDPVSDKEINRNNAVYGYQNNRNPFIDHPEYARMIWDPDWHGGGSAGAGDFVKVTSSNEITDGDYLIVCESNNVAFDGSLTTLDAVGNTIGVTITDGVIASSDATNAAVFTITAKTGGYSIKSAKNLYIGNTSNSNALKSSANDDYTNSITITDGIADIVCSSSHLRYNAANNQTRFRYFQSSTYTNQQAIQLYKKTEAYTITLATVTHGTITANASEAAAGSTITLTATPDNGYELDSWTVTKTGGGHVSVTNDQFVMPASNVTVSATFVYVGQPFEQKYYLVTSTDQLVAGRTYLIVNTTANKAMGVSSNNNNNRTAVDVSISNNMISSLGNACELTLGGQSDAWTFFDAHWSTTGGYLYAASSGSNYLKTQSNNDANGQWTISIDDNGLATIIAQGTNSRNDLRYNKNSVMFSCYASTQSLTDFPLTSLYIRSEDTTYTANTTLACLNTFDKSIIQSGVTLTATKVLGPSNQPQNIVIEDGAQLKHFTDGIQATVKRSIEAYTVGQSDGWYTIATPFTNTDTSQFATANFDLYDYNEAGPLEWTNYKANHSTFTMASTAGFLYAHNPSVTLRLTGTLNSGNYSTTVDLSYGNGDASLKGYNLLGNPTAHEINFTKSDSVSDGYYYLNNSSEWIYTTSTTVPVGRGFLVKANASNQSVTLNPQSKGERRQVEQYLAINIDGEQAYVKLTEGVSMPLLSFRGHSSSVYLNHEGQPYIMLVRDGANSIELNYRAPRQGRHQLQVDTQGADLPYLHLYDRLTGADIDLLQSPNYAFESATGNYASRFQLVFDPNASHEEDAFAYYANGRIIVDGPSDATLQIIDLTGRMVPNEHIVPGLYVLRLITPERVRIQKIVID